MGGRKARKLDAPGCHVYCDAV